MICQVSYLIFFIKVRVTGDRLTFTCPPLIILLWGVLKIMPEGRISREGTVSRLPLPVEMYFTAVSHPGSWLWDWEGCQNRAEFGQNLTCSQTNIFWTILLQLEIGVKGASAAFPTGEQVMPLLTNMKPSIDNVNRHEFENLTKPLFKML